MSDSEFSDFVDFGNEFEDFRIKLLTYLVSSRKLPYNYHTFLTDEDFVDRGFLPSEDVYWYHKTQKYTRFYLTYDSFVQRFRGRITQSLPDRDEYNYWKNELDSFPAAFRWSLEAHQIMKEIIWEDFKIKLLNHLVSNGELPHSYFTDKELIYRGVLPSEDVFWYYQTHPYTRFYLNYDSFVQRFRGRITHSLPDRDEYNYWKNELDSFPAAFPWSLEAHQIMKEMITEELTEDAAFKALMIVCS